MALLLGSRWNNPSLLTAHTQRPRRRPQAPHCRPHPPDASPFLCMNQDKRHREPKPQHLAPAGAKASPPNPGLHGISGLPRPRSPARPLDWDRTRRPPPSLPPLGAPRGRGGRGGSLEPPRAAAPCHVPVDFALLLSRSSLAAGAPTLISHLLAASAGEFGFKPSAKSSASLRPG